MFIQGYPGSAVTWWTRPGLTLCSTFLPDPTGAGERLLPVPGVPTAVSGRDLWNAIYKKSGNTWNARFFI